MRISELSERSGVSIATIKYYLREDLLHPGEALNARQSVYAATHLARVRLIRGLVHILGASIDEVRQILTVIDTPDLTPLEAMGQARRGVPIGPGEGRQSAGATPPVANQAGEDQGQDEHSNAPTSEHSLASDLLRRHGFTYDPTSPYLHELDQALALAEEVGISLDEEQMSLYTAAARQVARADFARIPWQQPKQAVQFAVLGTALYEPVLLALRRIAHDEQGLLRAAESGNTAQPDNTALSDSTAPHNPPTDKEKGTSDDDQQQQQ